MSMEVKRQICSLYRCESDTVMFEIMNVMRQQNSYDCGIYALACATELIYDKDPTLCQWDTQRMRKHLETCLERGLMTCFPSSPSKKRVRLGSLVRKVLREKIFCICRQPNDRLRAMIQCDNCRKWFHEDCVGLDTNISYSSIDWMCGSCDMLIKQLKDH